MLAFFKLVQLQYDVYTKVLSMGRAGSILDPTQTRPAGIRWKMEGPKTDRRHQSVELVLGSSDARVGSVGEESRRILQKVARIFKNLPISTKTSPKSAKISPFASKITEITRSPPNLDEELKISSTQSGWKSRDPHQIQVENSRSPLNMDGDLKISTRSR